MMIVFVLNSIIVLNLQVTRMQIPAEQVTSALQNQVMKSHVFQEHIPIQPKQHLAQTAQLVITA
jgi:hypothetical protein